MDMFCIHSLENDVSNSSEPVVPEQLDRKTRVKSILGGSAGNLVEWYDWYVYAAFTLYFAPQFFPDGDNTVKLLQAAAVLPAATDLPAAAVLPAAQSYQQEQTYQ